MTIDEYQSYDATDLAGFVRNGEVTPKELLALAIDRLETTNPLLNAVTDILYERACNDIVAGLPDGPFRGVPFLLKDQLDVAGVPTRRACRLLEEEVPEVDSEYVSRIRGARMVMFGKTNMPELGLNVTTEPEMYGPTRSPWNGAHSPGGSSGGSAAAVAAGICPAASATDGGGSIRIPASCCGLFGMKPSRGRVSFGPDRGEGWGGLTSHGLVSRSVRDSAALLDVLSGPALGTPYALAKPGEPIAIAATRKPGKLKIALVSNPPSQTAVDDECLNAVNDVVRLLKNLGHEIEECSLPVNGAELREASGLIIRTKIAESIEQILARRRRVLREGDLEPTTTLIYEAGRQVSGTQYSESIESIHRIGRQMAEFMKGFDAILSPTLAEPPIRLGVLRELIMDPPALFARMRSYSPFCNVYNASGQPAMSVPLYWGENNLPIGVQFAAALGQEAKLFQLAAQLEMARPWQQRYKWLRIGSTA